MVLTKVFSLDIILVISITRSITMSNPNDENLKISKAPKIYSNLDMIDDYFLFLETNNYSPMTIYDYKNDIAIFDNFLKSRNVKVKDLDKRQVFEFKAYLTSGDRETATTHLEGAKRLSSASVNRCLSAVKAYIRFLIDQEFNISVTADHFKMVKREHPHPHVAELNELQSLIEAP